MKIDCISDLKKPLHRTHGRVSWFIVTKPCFFRPITPWAIVLDVELHLIHFLTSLFLPFELPFEHCVQNVARTDDVIAPRGVASCLYVVRYIHLCADPVGRQTRALATDMDSMIILIPF